MLCKTRTTRIIAAGFLALALLLLAAGCVVSPGIPQVPVTCTRSLPPSVIPLPSLLLTDVQSYPSDAFKLKVLIKNSAGEPAPGARVLITFDNGDDSPVEITTDDRGYAVLDLHDEELTLPDARGNEKGSTSGTLTFAISTFWDNPNGGFEFLFGVVGQEIDLSVPSEIAVTVNLSSIDTDSP